MKLPFDPRREVLLRVTPSDGPEQVYTLRFGMAALDAAGRGYSIKPLSEGGMGVNKIVQRLSGEDLDGVCGFIFFSMAHHHPTMTWAECWNLMDIDLTACLRARAEMFNLTMPEPDPKEPAEPNAPPATAETETSPEPTTGT